MIKKIGLWFIFILLVGVLVFGAVNRTRAKTNQELGLLSGEGDEYTGSQSRGGGRNAGDPLVEDGEHVADVAAADWVDESGTVAWFDSTSLWIQLGGDLMLEIEGRAWRFAQESGYSPGEGNQVEIRGFYEDDEFEVSMIRDLTSGQVVFLRDDTGRPLWSGRSGK